MKARVKDTGVEIEVHLVDKQARYIGSDGITYWEEDLDFGIEDKNNPDYWTRLEHQYAGMAMQGFLASGMENTYEYIAEFSANQAQALVEKLKEKEQPDGSILVVTHNMLCINDILIQIKKQKLEGYTIEVDERKHDIKLNGRIAGSFPNKYAEQLRTLMNYDNLR